MNLLPRHSLAEYMAKYRADHTKLGTKVTHMIGIPLIVASLPTAFVSPPLAGGMMGTGLVLQFVGHYVFEKNNPSFFYDPYYTVIGPMWITAEWLELLGLPVPEMLRAHADAPAEAKPAYGNGVPASA